METLEFGDETLTLTVTTSLGPRILRLARRDGANVFAELGDLGVEHPNGTSYRFRGGHRLWVAPEVPQSTYLPDDDPVAIDRRSGAITMVAPAGVDGIRKTIRVGLAGNGAAVVDHRIENTGTETADAAAWAITQFPPDGTAVLPLPTEPADDAGLQANRSVVLWPYTNAGAPGVTWTVDAAVIEGSASPEPFKVGGENRRGWLAYWRGDELFVKWSGRHRDGTAYADRGASVQVYRNNRFVELETLSPLVTLAPGDAIEHREVWLLRRVALDRAGGLPAALLELGVDQQPTELERP